MAEEKKIEARETVGLVLMGSEEAEQPRDVTRGTPQPPYHQN